MGLMGGLIAGAVSGYAKQRVEDMDEKEKFDYQTALLDADFARKKLLQEMGFDQDVKLQETRHRDKLDELDYAAETTSTTHQSNAEFDANLKKEADADTRERLAGYAKDGTDPESVTKNMIENGDYDPDKMQALDTAIKTERAKSKSDKGKSTETKQKAVIDLILKTEGMTTLGEDNKAVGNNAAKQSADISGTLFMLNPDMPIGTNYAASIAGSMIPESERYVYRKDPATGEMYRRKGFIHNGQEFLLGGGFKKVEQPKPKKINNQTKPIVKPKENKQSIGLMGNGLGSDKARQKLLNMGNS